MYYEAITSLRKGYTVQQLSRAFSVSPSGYYAYLKRSQKGPSERDWRDKEKIVHSKETNCRWLYLSELVKS